MSSKRRLKVVITLVTVLIICFGAYGLSKVLVRHSFSSSELISKEDNDIVSSIGVTDSSVDSFSAVDETDSSTLSEYNTKFNTNLHDVDYSNREVKIEYNKTDRYNAEVKNFRELGIEDPEKYCIIPKSSYYGDYNTYYESDENTFLSDCTDFKNFLGLLKGYTKEFEELSNTWGGNPPGEELDRGDAEFSDSLVINSGFKYINYNNLMLVGVIDDRYYVYIDSSTNINSCSTVIVVDSSDVLICKPTPILKKLGETYCFGIYSSRTKLFNIDGKEVIYAKGY